VLRCEICQYDIFDIVPELRNAFYNEVFGPELKMNS
jgi:hypothetical protein